MLAVLQAWRRHGGSRLDRNNDGKIDDPGAAVIDTAWPKIANAFMRPKLGSGSRLCVRANVVAQSIGERADRDQRIDRHDLAERVALGARGHRRLLRPDEAHGRHDP